MEFPLTARRRATLLLTTLLALLCLAPAGAQAAPTVFGYGDQNTAMFTDPRWAALPLKDVRRTVDWDTQTDPAKAAQLDAWMQAAQAAGARPLLVIDRNWTAGKGNSKPTVKQYTALITWLRQKYPWWNTLTPWNEANYILQPTVHNPKLAYQYWQAAVKTCKGCTVTSPSLVAGLGSSKKFITDFVKLVGKKKVKVWAVHVYGDMNRKTDAGLKNFEKQLKGTLWVTETAGWVKFGDTKAWKYDTGRAAKVIDYTFKAAKKHKSRVKRWYFWQWLGNTSKESRWDSGVLNADGSPRPGYTSLVKGLKG